MARGANLSSATALELPNTSADIRNSTDMFFAAVDFISEAGKKGELDVKTGWPARSSDRSYSMIHEVHDQDYVASM